MENLLMLLMATVVFSAAPANGTQSSNAAPRSASMLYRRYCSSCHGRDGRADTARAKVNHSRDIADSAWQDDVSDERIFNSIMNGRNVRGNMPAFSKRLSEKEVESLVTFVRGLRK